MTDDPGRRHRRALAILIAAAALLAGVLLWGRMASSVRANLWNVSFVKSAVNGSPLPEPLPNASWWQQVWLGRAALERDDLPAAREAFASLGSNLEPFVLAAQGELAAAEGDISLAIKIWSAQGNYQALSQAAEKAENGGRDSDTRAYYQAMQLIRPEEATWLYTNYLWVSKKNAPDTEKLLIRALSDYPYSSFRIGWLNRLGEVFRVQGNYSESEKIFRQLLEEDPENIQALTEIGNLEYAREKDLNKALDYFKKLIINYPDAGIVMVAAGDILVREANFQAAEHWYGLALATEPDNIAWLLGKANIVRSSGDIKRSIILYQNILKQSPNYLQAYYDLSWAYRLDNQPNAAKNAIELALENDPDNEDYLFRAAAVYTWMNMEDDAKNAYLQVLLINPCNEQARQGIEKMGLSLGLLSVSCNK